jgi:DNA replication and repair protein RecF
LRLTELSARGFRNLSPDPIFFESGTTVLLGENAQGKTNLLEAVALLCGQRSFRQARPVEMAGSAEGFSIAGVVKRGFETDSLAVTWSPEGGRSFFLGEKPATFREASRRAPAVFLAPEHRELLAGPPAVRRRFLDRLVLALYPAAGDDLARYDTAVKSRNALLCRDRGRSAAPQEMEAWTEELVLAGSAVRRYRREALSEWRVFFAGLAEAAGPEYHSVSAGYVSDADSEEELRGAFQRLEAAERRRGYCLAGPHRDDLAFTRGGRPLSGQASSGEAHRIVFLIKLAEWNAVKAAAGEAPFFCVDDFDAGLSKSSAEALFEALPEAGTVILTGASRPERWLRKGAHVREMHAGRVSSAPSSISVPLPRLAVND